VRSGGPARITAIDRHPGKMARLQGRMRESSVPEVTAVVADVTTPGWADELGGFDAVLIDAPCTGLGTLRRYPEKRWRLMPQDLRRMADLQLTMLRRVAPAVRPGGRLVYATCSVARAENGDVLDAFAQTPEGRGFAAERIDALVPAEWQAFIDEAGRFRSWPMPGGPDGHFVARLRRTG
jgi:16S rRNA (cytosine967-C5)-methyltransferase